MLQQGPHANDHEDKRKSANNLLQMVAQETDIPEPPVVVEQHHGERNPERALSLLPDVEYFRELERSIPGFIDSASHVAEFHNVEKDMVVFRQDDPPACMYYVISGEVGIFINKRVDRPHTPEYRPRDLSKYNNKSCLTRLQLRFGFKQIGHKEQSARDQEAKNKDLFSRHETYEMFSTIAKGSYSGKSVATLGPGKCFADSALKNDDVRNATVKCLKDTEFLAIHKKNFDVKLCDKVCYFRTCVPGFKNYTHVGSPESHPATAFEDCDYKRGTILMQEDVVGEAKIVVVRSGKVSLRRRCRGTHLVGHEKGYRTWMVLEKDQVFCSLGMLGLGNIEPYSAVVASEGAFCYVFTGQYTQDFQDLPKVILDGLLETMRKNPVLKLAGSAAGLAAMPYPQKTWGGIVGEVSAPPPRPVSQRTLRSMRQYACLQGKSRSRVAACQAPVPSGFNL